MNPVAVIVPVEGATVEPTVEAVERQTLSPTRSVVVDELRETPDAEWLWLLDGGVIPEPTALEHLVNAAQAGEFALLASKIVTSDGTLHPASAPVPEVHRVGRVLTALEHHTVCLRVARRGSMLVRRDALRASGAFDHFDHDLEWTARLLAGHAGILEPKSVAARVAGRPPTGAADGLRLLAAVEPRERLWFAAHLAEQSLSRRDASRLATPAPPPQS